MSNTGLRLFLKLLTQLGIPGLILLLFKILEKESSTPTISTKNVDASLLLEIQKQKAGPLKVRSTNIFLDYPWKPHFFFN